MGVDLDGVRKERQALWEKLDGLEAKVQALDAEIKTLQDELEAVIQKREKTYETLQELRKQRDEAVCLLTPRIIKKKGANCVSVGMCIVYIERISFTKVLIFLTTL
jgi:predicted  nucleic acid-binding Zn-ribbon protein